jgi:cell shape-determining protein MreC
MEFSDILPYLASALTGVAGWLGGSRKRKNDFLNNLQASIDLLAEKNRLQMEEIIRLRDEIVKLREENNSLRTELGLLRRQWQKTIKPDKSKTGN